MENKSASYVICSVYYLMLVVYLTASFFPDYRVWGLNWWAFYPGWVRWGLLGIGLAAPIITTLILRWFDRNISNNEKTVEGYGRYLAFTAGLTAILGGLFYLLRTKAHFLGDGYQLLSRLAQDAPTLKMWDLGASLLNTAVFSMLDGSPDIRALHTFQIIAIVSGLLLIAGVAKLSRILFEKNTERMLFLIGLVSSGYMLLYFGYVENYAPPMACMTIYALVGLASLQNKISRLWAVGFFILSVALHLFAMALLPSLIYLLLKDTSIGKRLNTVQRPVWVLITGLVIVASVMFYLYLYSNYYFFTFALMPLFPDKFTIENDWLFSLKHITDMANLLLLMLPGLPLLVYALISRGGKFLSSLETKFMMILLGSTAGVVFIFNPGIGMPRNWDLFSLVGPPLTVAAYYLVIKNRQSKSDYRYVCVLSIVLSALILFPRATSLAIPEIGVNHYKNYLKIDKLRSRAGYTFLIKYYNEIGDRVNAELTKSYWDEQYPQRGLLTRCQQEYMNGNPEEAFRLCTRATEIDPVFYIPYFQLGSMYLDQKKPDSALAMFMIARGLNPYGADIVLGQAMAYAQSGDSEQAEKAWITVTEWTDELIDPHLFLMDLYKSRGDMQKYHDHLLVAGIRDDAPSRVIREVGDYYLSRKEFAQAADAFRRSIKKGLDSAYVQQLMARYPDLRRLMQ